MKSSLKDENNQKCPHLYIDSYDEQTLVCSHNEELGWIHIDIHSFVQ